MGVSISERRCREAERLSSTNIYTFRGGKFNVAPAVPREYLVVSASDQSQRTLFESIALAAMQEAVAVENEELRSALTVMALLKILFAQGTRLDWALRLSSHASLKEIG